MMYIKNLKNYTIVIINNEKGKKLFEEVKKYLNLINCTIEDCIKYTYTLTKATPMSENREKFWKDYKNEKFDYIIDKYAQKIKKRIFTKKLSYARIAIVKYKYILLFINT